MASIGKLIDQMADIDKEIAGHNAKIKKLHEKRSLFESDLMTAFRKQKITKASGTSMNARYDKSKHPSIEDMQKLSAYVKDNDAFDLFQRRVNQKAYFDRLEQGDTVPGIAVFERHSIKLTAKRG